MNWRQRLALAIAAFALAAPGCDSLPGRPRPSQRPIQPSQVTSFAVLYRQNCSGCHGADGRFGAALPLNNPIYLALVDDHHLSKTIAAGVPGTAMPAFAQAQGGSLSDAQIAIVMQGIRQRWGRTVDFTLPSYAGNGGGDPARGQKDFQTYCASCHGADGRGGKAGAVASAAYLALVSDQYLRSLIIAGRPDLGHPDWRGYGSRPLTAGEIDDLVAWLASQRLHPHGGAGFTSTEG